MPEVRLYSDVVCRELTLDDESVIHEPTSTSLAAMTGEASEPDRPSPSSGFSGAARLLRWTLRSVGRSIVFVVGMAVVGAGVAMLVLPGPGILVVLGGLVILATQFAWAERALDEVSERASSAVNKASASRGGRFAMGISAGGMVIGGGVVVLVDNGNRVLGACLILAGLTGLGFAVLQFPKPHKDPKEDPT